MWIWQRPDWPTFSFDARRCPDVRRGSGPGFEGGMTAGKYVGITGCSKATATRDLTALVQMGALGPLAVAWMERSAIQVPAANR
jgi:hypothetical protein